MRLHQGVWLNRIPIIANYYHRHRRFPGFVVSREVARRITLLLLYLVPLLSWCQAAVEQAADAKATNEYRGVDYGIIEKLSVERSSNNEAAGNRDTFTLGTNDEENLLLQSSRDSTKNLKISAFPVAFYTPETAFGFGGISIATFHLKGEPRETRPSSIQLGASYTTKNQILLYAPFEFYKDSESWRLEGELGFYKYFYNFFGVGIDSREEDEETYEVTFPRARLSLLREVKPGLFLGLGYQFDAFSNLKIEEGGILEASEVPGKRDGTVSNLGVLAFYDTRDDIFFPTKGVFIQGNIFTSSGLLGSSFNYSKYELDSRYY